MELNRLTGMRSGEAVMLRGCDIDTTGSVGIYRRSTHKNPWRGREQCNDLGPKTLTIVEAFLNPVEAFLASDVEAFLFSPTDAVSDM